MPFKEEANVGRLQVAYRETITRPAQAQGKYIEQSGGRDLYGDIWLKVEPNAKGKGFSFVDDIEGERVPKEHIKSVEYSARKTLENGILAGFPMVDIKVTFYDGSYRDVGSSEMAFKMAGSLGVKAAVRKAAPILLEPVMLVEVSTPLEFYKEVLSDLNRRWGTILGMESRGESAVVRADVPQAEILGYVNTLRSTTSGRASSKEEFAHYDPVPVNIAQEIIARARE